MKVTPDGQGKMQKWINGEQVKYVGKQRSTLYRTVRIMFELKCIVLKIPGKL